MHCHRNLSVRVAPTSALIVATLAGLLMSCCSSERTVERRVGNHVFNVPEKYIMDAEIFYLPASQNRELRLVNNPSAPPDDQNLVTFYADDPCPTAYGRKESNQRCKAVAVPVSVFRNDSLIRTPSNDRIWWHYILAKRGIVVASCSTSRNGTDGLCVHDGLYRDIRYSVHFRNSQINNLSKIRTSLEAKLTAWEKK